MSGVPGMRRKYVRTPSCHPDELHHAKGLCRRCYQRRLGHEIYHGVRIPKPKKVTVWPQAVVPVPVRGWGFLG